MGCQNTKVVAENVEKESKQHIMISYSWESGQKTDFSCNALVEHLSYFLGSINLTDFDRRLRLTE